MAAIRKRTGKTGDSYLIISSNGRDMYGRQVRISTTWRPAPDMTAAQIKRAVKIAAADFDKQCEQGFKVDKDGFQEAMKEQQERARAAHTKVSAKVVTPDTTKLDQSKLVNDETAVKATIAMLGKEGVEISEARDGQEVTIILDDKMF